MGEVAAFGEIQLALSGQHAAQPGGGKLAGYEWWQSRGFDVSFEMLDAAGHPERPMGTVAFLVHRRQKGLQRPKHYASDRSGIRAARTTAAETGVTPGADDLFYEAAADGTANPVEFHEERPLLLWPVGVQTMATYRITAWFVPTDGPIVFAERDIDLFWADVKPPSEPVGVREA